jgi:AcrR family transcriptional regulator
MRPGPGRPRNTELDDSILRAAQAELARHGYQAMSVSAIADSAGTTRQAIYRRWPSKADLATAAIAALAHTVEHETASDPFAALVAELTDFARGVARPDGLPMVGTMLLGAADPDLARLYRQRVVAPRRQRLRAILTAARDAGQLHADADIDTAVPMLTGSWYATALAGRTPPHDWPRRAATLLWRALGGHPPDERP